MIKKVVTLSLTLMLFANMMAQRAFENSAKIGDVTAPAYSMSLEKDIKLVQDAVKQRLKDTKMKTKNVGDYTAAIEQTVPEIASTPVNIYIKVEEQGKRKDRVSILTVSVIPTDLTMDQEVLKSNVQKYVESYFDYVNKYEAGLNMKAEQKNLDKALKAQSSAISVVTGLEKSIKSDTEKIKDKQNEIKRLQEKISDCEKEIKRLEANINSNNEKKAEAEKKVEEAGKNVRTVEGEVDRYRQMAQ